MPKYQLLNTTKTKDLVNEEKNNKKDIQKSQKILKKIKKHINDLDFLAIKNKETRSALLISYPAIWNELNDWHLLRDEPFLAKAINTISAIGQFSYNNWVILKNNEILQQAICAIAATGNFSNDDWKLLKKNGMLQKAVNAVSAIGRFSHDDWYILSNTKSLQHTVANQESQGVFSNKSWLSALNHHPKLEEIKNTFSELFDRYVRQAYEEQRYGPKPQDDKAQGVRGIYDTSSRDEDEKKFQEFKEDILKDDRILDRHSKSNCDEYGQLEISTETIAKVKASKHLFKTANTNIPFSKKVDQLGAVLKNKDIISNLNEQKTTFGKFLNALKNICLLRWGHINETAGANTVRSTKNKLTLFHENLVNTQPSCQNDNSLTINN
ncbi:hypothetical protein [Piscirickettsia salmonis]|uniref:hypothetical protein n=1 Tax=Piscirickettsia salmonis TaxID=1238 RepID=UPI0007C8B32F|nr:hypothetical protein A0O36_02716 [Piscirickettsiaceae bacterium NZ-RLO1]